MNPIKPHAYYNVDLHSLVSVDKILKASSNRSFTLRAESFIFLDESGRGKKTLPAASTFRIEHALEIQMHSVSVTRDK